MMLNRGVLDGRRILSAAAVDDLLTGHENLELIGRLYGLDRGTAGVRADELLGRFDLADAADLRDRIFEHPDILPVAESWSQFWPLVPLGTEVAGIDALFVSPGGFLTIVETKLVDE